MTTKETKHVHHPHIFHTELDKFINGKSPYLNALLRDLYLINNPENLDSEEESLHYLSELRKERQSYLKIVMNYCDKQILSNSIRLHHLTS